MGNFRGRTSCLLRRLIFGDQCSRETHFPIFLQSVRPPQQIELVAFIFRQNCRHFSPNGTRLISATAIKTFNHATSIQYSLLMNGVRRLFIRRGPMGTFRLMTQVLAIFIRAIWCSFQASRGISRVVRWVMLGGVDYLPSPYTKHCPTQAAARTPLPYQVFENLRLVTLQHSNLNGPHLLA